MASSLNPYLSFRDTARDAMTYYQSVFGGDLNIVTFADFGQGEGGADLVMHSSLQTTSGYVLFASDTPPSVEFVPGGQIALCLSGDDADELRRYFRELADGGQVRMPLGVQAWGDEFGLVEDRFGISWMVNIDTRK